MNYSCIQVRVMACTDTFLNTFCLCKSCIILDARCTLYIVHCTVYREFTLYTVMYTIYSVHMRICMSREYKHFPYITQVNWLIENIHNVD